MEDVKIKREVRRRKILENSEKRLQKINLCKLQENDIDETIHSNVKVSVPIYKSATKKVEDFKIDANATSNDLTSVDPTHRVDSAITNNASNFTQSSHSSKNTIARSNTSIQIWKTLGFKLAILAVFVRVIHIFKFGYLFGETIVIPFALFMMTQLGSCQFDQNISGITGPILFFIGVSPNKIKNLLICYNVVTSILIYFGIYFFTFVLAHLICVIVLGL